jgi:hypothetical protein
MVVVDTVEERKEEEDELSSATIGLMLSIPMMTAALGQDLKAVVPMEGQRNVLGYHRALAARHGIRNNCWAPLV